jgi:predicted DNA-binding transcriptional regulator AlpA
MQTMPPPETTVDALSIDEFCARHGISRGSFYNLRKAGLGPREMKLGARVLISVEAAADWRRQREAKTTHPST